MPAVGLEVGNAVESEVSNVEAVKHGQVGFSGVKPESNHTPTPKQ